VSIGSLPEVRWATAAITAITGQGPVLLTGDNQRAAARLAAQAGITDVRAGLLPEDKVRAVRELQSAGRKVLLAGDGVNDAPALAAASTGAAMGRAGSAGIWPGTCRCRSASSGTRARPSSSA
jgi:cation-transporting P-type ATPase J